jgi:hypothetical protein
MAANKKKDVVTNDPHPVVEDPEDHIGDELPDPWITADADGNWKDVTEA